MVKSELEMYTPPPFPPAVLPLVVQSVSETVLPPMMYIPPPSAGAELLLMAHSVRVTVEDSAMNIPPPQLSVLEYPLMLHPVSATSDEVM